MTSGTTFGQEKSLQEDDTEAEKEVATKSGRGALQARGGASEQAPLGPGL